MGRFNQSMRALVAWRGGLFLTEGKNEDGEIQLIYESACCLAWGVIFDRMKVLSVSSLFLMRVGVYVGASVCVCIRTHTHTLHRWGTWMRAQESG